MGNYNAYLLFCAANIDRGIIAEWFISKAVYACLFLYIPDHIKILSYNLDQFSKIKSSHFFGIQPSFLGREYGKHSLKNITILKTVSPFQIRAYNLVVKDKKNLSGCDR